MKILKYIILSWLALWSLSSCTDDESFTTSASHLLTFSVDSVRVDTIFSNVPSSTRTFWVYNHSGDGIRCTQVRLERGNQSGFRVNVNGIYLSPETGYQTQGLELRNKDSVQVFVEVTAPANNQSEPTKLEDNLLFTLESGVVQKINLNAYAWDAQLLKNVHITRDTTLAGTSPRVIYGELTVDSGATLTLAPGTTLYFHGDAGMQVYGRLKSNGTAGQEVMLRGDRLDRMFDYLPYDGVSGQWKGIRFHTSSYDNELFYTDLHSTFDGVVCDSSDIEKTTLVLENSTIHNCQGYGLLAVNSRVVANNTQITNTLNDCLHLDGGHAMLNQCTLAQFYPFDANRGAAIAFTDKYPLLLLDVKNSLMTGYADDVLMGTRQDDSGVFNYHFADCVIRTPSVEAPDDVNFERVLFEDVKDTVTMGTKHFKDIDGARQRYDFSLSSASAAIGRADAATSLPTDRKGTPRDDKPDVGAYEYKE